MAKPTIMCNKCGTEFPKVSFRCTSCGEIGISKLYKYVRLCDHSLSILRDKKIWFHEAGSLNDPFEFDFTCTEMNINDKPIDIPSFEESISKMKQMGVLSLSEINNNILMWSHYSYSHTGFCIEFERTDSNALGNSNCVPVNYVENLPMVKPIELTDRNTVIPILITKSDSWAYEKEWRMIAKKGNQTYDLPGSISGIIFGINMPIEHQRMIKAILGGTVKYMCAFKSKTKFAIDINS